MSVIPAPVPTVDTYLYLRDNSNRHINFISFLFVWPDSPGFHFYFFEIFLQHVYFHLYFAAGICFVEDITVTLSGSVLNISIK
jgi:hypothetical protein